MTETSRKRGRPKKVVDGQPTAYTKYELETKRQAELENLDTLTEEQLDELLWGINGRDGALGRRQYNRKPGAGTGPRPHTWLSGPDPYRHEIYTAWLARRAQANFRLEEWNLNFEEFFTLWNGNWEHRGRQRHNVCMSRHDPEKPWDSENTYIRSRYDQLLEQAEKRRQWGYRMQEQGLNYRGK